MALAYVQRVFVAAHTAAAPSTAEWTKYCEQVTAVRSEVRATLVYTLGGAPTSVQREALRDAYADRLPPPMVIMTGSAVVRGIVTSLNWFLNNQLIAVPLADFDRAFAYLEGRAGPLPRTELRADLAVVAGRLGIALPRAAIVEGMARF